MSWATIIDILKTILPTKRIAAWLLAVLCAGVALLVGVSSADIKASFCASDTVINLPKLQPAVVPAPSASPSAAPSPSASQ
jgi:hypothetical protein